MIFTESVDAVIFTGVSGCSDFHSSQAIYQWLSEPARGVLLHPVMGVGAAHQDLHVKTHFIAPGRPAAHYTDGLHTKSSTVRFKQCVL